MRPLLAKIKADFATLGNLERQRLGAVIRRVGLTNAEPRKLGLAVALGVTIGLTPLYGLHLLIAILVALVLRLNVAVIYAAANISLPPFVPLIAVVCVQVGHVVVNRELMTFSGQSAETLLKTFPLYWMLGSLIVGPLGGGLLGLVVYGLASRRKPRPEPKLFAASVERLYQAFLPDGRFAAEVLRGKVRHDVVYDQVLHEARTAASVVDVGGGHGALPLLLAVSRPPDAASDLRVLDWDEPKLAAGRRAAARLGVDVAFVQADVFASEELSPDSADCVTCLDVLHYAPLPRQRELVARMAAALKPGGKLLIRDMNADLRLRTFCTVVQERMSLFARRTLASAVVPRPGRDLTAQLVAAGLRVSARPCFGKTPFSNTLWVAERPAAAPLAGQT